MRYKNKLLNESLINRWEKTPARSIKEINKLITNMCRIFNVMYLYGSINRFLLFISQQVMLPVI